jgi:glyceraldehyde-3-phosphate dehydrogenase/erythrose-4-phosphate dehydrogenase
LKGIAGYTEEEPVSTDFMQTSVSGTIDGLETKVMENLVKTLARHDNEWGIPAGSATLLSLPENRP